MCSLAGLTHIHEQAAVGKFYHLGFITALVARDKIAALPGLAMVFAKDFKVLPVQQLPRGRNEAAFAVLNHTGRADDRSLPVCAGEIATDAGEVDSVRPCHPVVIAPASGQLDVIGAGS